MVLEKETYRRTASDYDEIEELFLLRLGAIGLRGLGEAL